MTLHEGSVIVIVMWRRTLLVCFGVSVALTNACGDDREYASATGGQGTVAGGGAGRPGAAGGGAESGGEGTSTAGAPVGGESGAAGSAGVGGTLAGEAGAHESGAGNSTGGSHADNGGSGNAGESSGGASGTGGAGGSSDVLGGAGSGGLGDPGAHCEWNCTGDDCVVGAVDEDGDGHGTSECAAAPGDDCDDSNEDVHPDATEVCDVVDNDCDGKIDLADGLSLTGAVKDVDTERQGVVVGSLEDGTFGLLGLSPNEAGLFFGTIASNGTASWNAIGIFEPSSTTAYLDPHMAWGSALGHWGVVYSTNGIGGKNANAGVMAFNSSQWQSIAVPGVSVFGGDITARGQGDLLMLTASISNLYLSTIVPSESTAQSGSLAITGSWDAYTPQVAADGSSAAVIWQTAVPRALNWSSVSSALQFGAAQQVSTAAYHADLATIGAGYGLAWIEGAGFRFTIKKANGSNLCSSSVISFGTVAANKQVVLQGTSNGTVVVVTDPDSNAIHLYRFDDSCKVIDDTSVSSTASAPTNPQVALSRDNLVVYWEEASTGRYRWLSELLCQ